MKKLFLILALMINNLASAQLQANFSCDTISCDTVNHWCIIQFTDLSTTNTGFINAWFYDFGNGTTAILPNPIIWYPYGIYTVCHKAFSSVGDSSEICCYLNVNADSIGCDCPPVGIYDLTVPNIQFQLFPNPVKETLKVFFNKKEKILITNLLGEILLQKSFSTNANGKMELDVSILSSGIYFIKAGNEVKKFVKE